MLQELKDKRLKLIADARKLVDRADTEKRSMSTEEEAQFNTMIEDANKLDLDIGRREKLEKVEKALAEIPIEQRAVPAASTSTAAAQGYRAVQTATENKETTEERAMRHFDHWCSTGLFPAGEERALQAGSDIIGGFLRPPEQFVAELLKNVDDAVFIRGLSRKFTLAQAENLGVPTLDTDVSDADWTTELLIGSEDTSMAIGKRQLFPHPLAKLVKVSETLLRVSAIPVEALVRERLSYKFGVTEEKAFLTGSGAAQPLGVMTASDNGISTSRDVSEGNTTTEIKADGLKNAKWELKPQYWGAAQWIFHRDGLKQIAKIKDGVGQYMWQPGISTDDRGGSVLGFPAHLSEFQNNTFTTGLYVGILGDFSKYWIVDTLGFRLQRLNELYAATNQVGFIGRMELDAMPVLEEAFIRVKLA